jgi:hypothetical protein
MARGSGGLIGSRVRRPWEEMEVAGRILDEFPDENSRLLLGRESAVLGGLLLASREELGRGLSRRPDDEADCRLWGGRGLGIGCLGLTGVSLDGSIGLGRDRG